jgi:predicted DNA-binding ribbon-helix-helix protein
VHTGSPEIADARGRSIISLQAAAARETGSSDIGKRECNELTQGDGVTHSRLVNKNVRDGTRRTSIRLEPEYWDAAHDICRRENMSISKLVERATKAQTAGGRTSALRTYIVTYFRAASAGSSLHGGAAREVQAETATHPD